MTQFEFLDLFLRADAETQKLVERILYMSEKERNEIGEIIKKARINRKDIKSVLIDYFKNLPE